jgi:hypothetical protein
MGYFRCFTEIVYGEHDVYPGAVSNADYNRRSKPQLSKK